MAFPTILRFNSKSRDAPPGCGAGETLNPLDDYSDLAKQPHWRRMLSNFHLCEVPIDGLSWASVEHYYHARKINHVTNEPIDLIHARLNSLGVLECKRATNAQNLQMSSQMRDAWDELRGPVLVEGLRAKFVRNEDLSNLLIKTSPAVLSHISRGATGDAFGLGGMLMSIRDELMR